MVSKLNSSEIIHFLLILIAILIPARLLGELCRRYKLPAITGEIFAGILIGPTLLGYYFPDLFHGLFLASPKAYGAFDGIANIGIILLMFIAGFEVDLKQIRDNGKQALAISLTGILFPFAIGFACVWLLYQSHFADAGANRFVTSLFFGTALSITALSVITKILIDVDILKTRIGNIVLTAAMVDDFLGWILFSIIIKMISSDAEEASFWSVLQVILFAAFMLTGGRWIIHRLLAFAGKNGNIGKVFTVAVCLCFVGAVLTEYLGVRGIFGAFLVGVAVSDSEYFTAKHKDILHQFTINVLAPLFFASVGLRLNFIANFNLEIVLLILVVACLAKLAGAMIGGAMSGMSKNESIAVAFGMNARGSQEIVLGLIALQAKIINEPVFEGLVVMTVVTMIISGPIMKYYFLKEQKKNITTTTATLGTAA
ncbi:cation:proton antiporter [Mucilaginibacter myungsuensis]|uniref:Cation:proton antiporter n=1 Tax=Mucilaginibacter myungsuensis TaxID=649104 RepID=A0A929PXI6_9SPHI|nr:cation:proton antiporter [Mucilaginibacter myungsuensis]MBE9663216.1 cation:proton antiporter [Mucilaginibacter myungsuensis]MDN3598849.1 cation:proton antiporter [Mucilaginibacter myungsuensis]